MESIDLQKCCNQLLNLGKRNKLLYYSPNSACLSVYTHLSEDDLFQDLVNGDTFEFFDLDGFLSRNHVTFDSYNSDISIRNEYRKLASKEFDRERDSSRLLLFPYRASLNKTRKRINGLENGSIEDHGVSLLHLALGRLHWSEKPTENGYVDEEIDSPLLLIPVTLYFDRNKQAYSLGFNGRNDVTNNNTLSFLLKQEYGITLPEFDHEKYTVSSYLQAVEETVSAFKGWSITNEIILGLFTFSKISRYRDLKDNENTVLNNPNVQKLFGKHALGTGEPVPREFKEEKEKKERPFLPLHNVVDADSSQFEAIECAKQGDSFVLEGPPGTGKSQTITNLIAEARYDGKTVLFVAEKAAALDVVYHKLSQVGLSDFCLYLHGNVERKEILSDIDNVLKSPLYSVTENAAKTKESLKEEEEYLNSYADSVYKRNEPREQRVFQILGEADLLHEVASPSFLFGDRSCFNHKFLEDNLARLKEVTDLSIKLGRKEEDLPFYGRKEHSSDYDFRVRFEGKIDTLYSRMTSFSSQWEKISKLLELNDNRPRKDVLSVLEEKQVIESLRFFDPYRFDESKRGRIQKNRNEVLKNLKRKKESKFLEGKDIKILSVSGKERKDKFDNEYSSFFRFLKKEYRKDRTDLAIYSNQNKLSFRQAKKLVLDLKDYQDILSDLSSSLDKLNDNFVKPDRITEENAETFSDDRNRLLSLKGITFNLLSKEKESLFCELKESLSAVSSIQEEEKRKKEVTDFVQYFDLGKNNLLSLSYDAFISSLSRYKKNRADFPTNRRLYQLYDRARENGYRDFLKNYLYGDYLIENLSDAFKKCFYVQLSHALIEQDPILSSASRRKNDDRENGFKRDDRTSFKIHQAEVKEQCTGRIPNPNDNSGGIVSCFEKEAAKKRRLISIRRRRTQFGPLIKRVKPCFRMSPLNVSSFLNKDRHFDLIIFDEASQVFPWDAIGSIYRGSQLIIAGDNKQMPPTSFFQTSYEDDSVEEEEEGDDISAFESILDYAVAYPHKRLTWHYRSKSEELIAFSNENFYDGRLTTFPSATKKKEGFGIDFYFVRNGNYRKKRRTNSNEATKVVDLVCQDIRDYPKESIGIVARNRSQQEEIQSQLDKRRESDRLLRKYTSENGTESLFVKNLENVQGDERDRIIFSVGYGKGQDGKLSLNFGALNQRGGERRLNVAITRSRVNRQVVSSIHYYDIDLDRTSSLGRKRLRGYLEYAEKGTRLSLSKAGTEELRQSPFEQSVYQALTNHGYHVDCQVGCSGYRIDFGVKHPDKNLYVLAIECDGATYHASHSARDRDRLHQQVLESKGWNFYRIWSVDWFKDRKNEEERLFLAVDEAIKETGIDCPSSVSSDSQEVKEDSFDDLDELEDSFSTREEKPAVTIEQTFPSYQEETIVESSHQLSVGEIAWRRPMLDDKILAIIKKEQPVCESILLSKLASLLGRKKVSSQITNTFFDIRCDIRRKNQIQKHNGKLNTYYWIDDKDIKLRINSSRTLEEIPDIELKSGLLQLVKNEYIIAVDGLAKLLLKTIGYKSCPKQSCDEVTFLINQLIIDGKLTKDQFGNVSIPQ